MRLEYPGESFSERKWRERERGTDQWGTPATMFPSMWSALIFPERSNLLTLYMHFYAYIHYVCAYICVQSYFMNFNLM